MDNVLIFQPLFILLLYLTVQLLYQQLRSAPEHTCLCTQSITLGGGMQQVVQKTAKDARKEEAKLHVNFCAVVFWWGFNFRDTNSRYYNPTLTPNFHILRLRHKRAATCTAEQTASILINHCISTARTTALDRPGNTTPLHSARDAHRRSQFAPIHVDEMAQNGNSAHTASNSFKKATRCMGFRL